VELLNATRPRHLLNGKRGLLLKITQIFGAQPVVASGNLVATAIKANGVAKRDVDIERQRRVSFPNRALCQRLRVGRRIVSLDKSVGGGVAGVPWAALVISPDDLGVQNEIVARIQVVEGE
jgi:hypothetical protein